MQQFFPDRVMAKKKKKKKILVANILVVRFCRFCWCKVEELSVLIIFLKKESKSLYTSRKHFLQSPSMQAFSFWP